MGFDLTKGVGHEMVAVLPQDKIPWYKKNNLRWLNLSIGCVILFSSANGYDGSLMNGLQALPQWQEFMQHPKGSWLGFINAIQSLGAVLCVPLVAWSNNRLGRKKTLGMGYVWLALGVGLQAGGSSEVTFVLGRLFIGGVSATFGATAPLLITETAYPTHRGIVTALYNTGWYVGSTIAAWATYGTRNYDSSWGWRVPSVLQLLIPLLALPGFLLCPESPRWLLANERTDEARAFFIKYHANGDENSPLVAFEMEEVSSTLRMERELHKTTSYIDMLRTKGNRHRTLITVTLGIFSQWNGVGVASYYLAPILETVGITSVTKQILISGFLQIWNLLVAVSSAFSVDALGRRRIFLISTTGMLVSYIVISGLAGSFAHDGAAAVGTAVIPFLFVFYGFYDVAFTPLLFAYPCEIWPYTLRARGVAVVNMSTQLALFFNIFVNPIALDAIGWKYYIVYVAILIVILCTIWHFYPETSNHSLEEMARIFDGNEAAVPLEGSTVDKVAGRQKGDSGYSHLETA